MDEISLFLESLQIDTSDLELTLRIALQVVLLVSSAVFSGSETAMFSLSRIDLQKLRNTRNPHSEGIHAMLDEEIGDGQVADYIQPPLFLSPKQTVDLTLPLLQARDDHMGIVVDEFGSAIGILRSHPSITSRSCLPCRPPSALRLRLHRPCYAPFAAP